MAKKSKVKVIELQYAGKIHAVNFIRYTTKPYMLGRNKVMNSYPLTSSSRVRVDKLLKDASGFYLYTVLGYKVDEWEPREEME